MGSYNLLVIISIVGLLIFAVFIVYFELENEFVQYKSYEEGIRLSVPNESNQFYPNMRFMLSTVSYNINPDCDPAKIENIRSALNVIEEKTNIRFNESNGPGISFSCTGNTSEYDPVDRRHILAGLAKPNTLLNLTNFYIINEAKVTLLIPERCPTPNIAIHEILHSLGFDHSNDPNSIMYPVSNCNQQIDSQILNKLNRLYSIPQEPDIILENIVANRSGTYLNVMLEIANYGLADAKNVTIKMFSDDTLLNSYNFDVIEVGKKSKISISNIRTNPNNKIRFSISMNQTDLNPKNNQIELTQVN